VLNSPNLKGIVSLPDSSTEAELLLETARAEFKLWRIQKQLADQQVQCNLLRLEYSRLQVQRMERHLLEVEGHVGHVRLVTRRCRYASGSSESGHNGEFLYHSCFKRMLLIVVLEALSC